MRVRLVLSLLILLGLSAPPRGTEPEGVADAELRAALDAFTGTWSGTFKVYRYDGRLLDQLETTHQYEWVDSVQHGVFVDRYPDGRTVRAEARNYVRDGVLYCEVEKENGVHTLHRGRLEGGVVFWYRQVEDGAVTESFRERVVETSAGRVYRIDGFGVYREGEATSYLLYEGRYAEVSE